MAAAAALLLLPHSLGQPSLRMQDLARPRPLRRLVPFAQGVPRSCLRRRRRRPGGPPLVPRFLVLVWRAGARARPLPSVSAAPASPRPANLDSRRDSRPVHAMQDHDALQVEAYLRGRKRQALNMVMKIDAPVLFKTPVDDVTLGVHVVLEKSIQYPPHAGNHAYQLQSLIDGEEKTEDTLFFRNKAAAAP